MPPMDSKPPRELELPRDCAAHASMASDLSTIKADVRTILNRLGSGDVTFATMLLRVQLLEKLVYGAVAVALLGMATAVVSLAMGGLKG